MLSVANNTIMINGVMLNVIMLIVVAPFSGYGKAYGVASDLNLTR
jgi:hypothetical protein